MSTDREQILAETDTESRQASDLLDDALRAVEALEQEVERLRTISDNYYALLVEKNQQLAEKDAYNERLENGYREELDKASQRNYQLRFKLAAAQAQIVGYLDELNRLCKTGNFRGVQKIITQPADTSALDAIRAEAAAAGGEVMRERALVEWRISDRKTIHRVGYKIRALPGVTLADLNP